jgi:hypothetical protein
VKDMLCCAGLFGGLYVGQQLGGPWTVIAPATGFGVGLLGDMKLMHKSHKDHHEKAEENEPYKPPLVPTFLRNLKQNLPVKLKHNNI